jgi:hypothetical protein
MELEEEANPISETYHQLGYINTEAALLDFLFLKEAYLISGNLCLERSHFGINK